MKRTPWFRVFVSGLFLTVFMVAGSCTTSSKKPDSKNKITRKVVHPKPPRGYRPAKAKVFKKILNGIRPRFSPSENKFVYISQNRDNHKHPQVYEYNLILQKERRLTFHDGMAFEVDYSSDGQRVIYSSNTDEIKENPDFIKSALMKTRSVSSLTVPYRKPDVVDWARQPKTELYVSDVDGQKIERLTYRPGFDGHPSFDPNKERVIFTSQAKSGYLHLQSLNLKSKKISPLTGGKFFDVHPRFSPDGRRLLWERRTRPDQPGDLWIGNSWAGNARVLLTNSIGVDSPSWHPDGKSILFTSNHEDQTNFEIYVADIEAQCVRRLTYDGHHDKSPQFSPDGKKVVFTSNKTGEAKVYMMDYKPPQGCSIL